MYVAVVFIKHKQIKCRLSIPISIEETIEYLAAIEEADRDKNLPEVQRKAKLKGKAFYWFRNWSGRYSPGKMSDSELCIEVLDSLKAEYANIEIKPSDISKERKPYPLLTLEEVLAREGIEIIDPGTIYKTSKTPW